MIRQLFEKKQQNKCPKCGKRHPFLPAIAFDTPHYFNILSEDDKRKIAEISDDFCVIRHEDQTDRFIRAVMSIPIIGECDTLDYGIWVSLSEKSFNNYFESFDREVDEQIFFGRICNEIKFYEKSTLGLHANIRTRNGGHRPEVIPHESTHELIHEWEHGISRKEAESRISSIHDLSD